MYSICFSFYVIFCLGKHRNNWFVKCSPRTIFFYFSKYEQQRGDVYFLFTKICQFFCYLESVCIYIYILERGRESINNIAYLHKK